MAEPIPLDPGAYGGTYKLIGGAVALDFTNLVSYRGTPRAHDWLIPADNLRRWTEAADIEVVVPSDLDALIRLRDAMASVFLDVVDGRDPRGTAFDAIVAATHRAREHQQLRWDPGAHRAVWALQRPALCDVLALDAADLLTDDAKRGRLGACQECRWVYLDTTRNRSRRWCDPADCGNRARQRRHYRRVR